MSSSTYSTELVPDRRLRRVTLIAGLAASVLGVLTILGLPIDNFVRAILAGLWLIVTAAELALIASAHKKFRRIRIHCDGQVMLCDRDGNWQAAAITSGCVLLPSLGWLKLRPASGGTYRELICGNSRESEQWRRLQVIWRHLGSARRSC